jgi:hypothetical protein
MVALVALELWLVAEEGLLVMDKVALLVAQVFTQVAQEVLVEVTLVEVLAAAAAT